MLWEMVGISWASREYKRKWKIVGRLWHRPIQYKTTTRDRNAGLHKIVGQFDHLKKKRAVGKKIRNRNYNFCRKLKWPLHTDYIKNQDWGTKCYATTTKAPKMCCRLSFRQEQFFYLKIRLVVHVVVASVGERFGIIWENANGATYNWYWKCFSFHGISCRQHLILPYIRLTMSK